MILNKIGESYNCDKADNNHQFDGESYFDIYEKYFLKFTLDVFTIIHIL